MSTLRRHFGRRFGRILAASATGVAAVALLAACATGTAVDPGSNGQEVPDGGASSEIPVEGAWLDGGRVIGLVTSGSSSCVPTAGTVELEDSGTLAVQFEEPSETTPCTRDLVPRITLVPVPESVDPSQNLDVVVTGVGYHGNVQLPGVPDLDPAETEEFTPSAGWTGHNGEFIVLTWGSSTCPEIIENSEVTGEDTVTVTFAAQDETKPCTADMAPQPVLAFADGLANQPHVVATLVGPNFPETKVEILGENHVHIPLG